MRNDFIGTSIDGDRAACCKGGQNNNGNTINTAGCGCNRQTRANTCGCDCGRQSRGNTGEAWQNRSGSCTSRCDAYDNDCRARYNDCTCKGDRQPCHDDGPCEKERQPRSSCCCNGRTPGMVYAQHHDLDNMYCAEKALLRGTLFGCLDKPMCNVACADNACTTQCQEDQFAIWELRLYLNTHPCDKEALAMLHKLTEKLDEDCGCAFVSDCSRWSWLDGPWPWEYQRCCGKEA